MLIVMVLQASSIVTLSRDIRSGVVVVRRGKVLLAALLDHISVKK